MIKKTSDQILLESIIDSYKEENDFKDDSRVFSFFSIDQITKNLEISQEEIEESMIDGSNDGGIDAVLFFCNDTYFDDVESLKGMGREINVKIQIVQVKDTTKIEEDVITRFQSSLTDIFDLSKNLDVKVYSPAFIDKANLIRNVWTHAASKNNNIKVEIFYVSKANFSSPSGSFKNKKNQVEEIFNNNDISNKFYLVGAKELRDLSKHEEDYTAHLTFDQVTNSKRGDGYIGFVKLDEYYRCITDDREHIYIREHIFEDNVRDHLGGREINKEIMMTLRSAKKESFWCLNNGITIISSEITPSGNTLNMRNIQIVNGLQTSYQVYNAKKEGEVFGDNHFLIVKVVKTDNEELKTDIVRSTNRQTAVEVSGFRALDRIQVDIEDFLKKHKLYYDRRKNYYKNQGKPTKSIVSVRLLAQCIFSMIYKEPSTARSDPRSLLAEEENYNKIFPDLKDNLWLFLFSIRLFNKVNLFLTKLKKQYKGNSKKEIEEVVASNYKFHICRVLMFILTGEDSVKLNDVIKRREDLEKKAELALLESEIEESFNLLLKIMKKYLEDNHKTLYDLISISKNPALDKEITKHLKNL